MRQINVLIADDNRMVCKLLSNVVSKAGYEVFVATNLKQCLALLQDNKIDILFQDLCFPSLQDGFSVLEFTHTNYPEVMLVAISAKVQLSDALQVFNYGVADYLEKPIIPEHLIAKIKFVENRIFKEDKNKDLVISAIGMVGVSKAMQNVYDNIILAAQFDTPVLITGETGVGKELVAQAIHKLSRHASQNLISVNCGAIPRDLVESELFGYEQGSFTGALRPRKGYFEYADGKDILLDEIAELPIQVQAKLLRILSEGDMQKLGGKAVKINCRVICSTNRDLKAHVQNGSFREDLFYRINTIHIEVPALKERKDDILELAVYFLNKFCVKNNLIPKSISPQAMQWLIEQEWKGNVRELRNTIERGVIFSKNDYITVPDFQPSVKQLSVIDGKDSNALRTVVQAFEKGYIYNFLCVNNWNITHTAKALKLDKSNLLKKMKYYEINKPKK